MNGMQIVDTKLPPFKVVGRLQSRNTLPVVQDGARSPVEVFAATVLSRLAHYAGSDGYRRTGNLRSETTVPDHS
jgi:hypothetical protein